MKKNIGLIGNIILIVMLGIVTFSIFSTISNTEITQEQIKDFNPVMTVIIVWIVVPCIAIPIGIIINWKRFKELYLKKNPEVV